MTERMLITKLIRTEDDRADLFGKDRIYKDFTLFSLSDLFDVGIDYINLEIGAETPCRFWCIYQLSEKLNKAGNPYKDVIALEPIDKPATTTSTDTSAIVAELRAIRALLSRLLDTAGPSQDEPTVEGPGVAHPAAHLLPQRARTAGTDQPKTNGDRDRFYQLAAQARADSVAQEIIDEIVVQIANTHGFALACECLAAEATRQPGKDYDHRQAIVARLEKIMAQPLVTTGQVASRLGPSWQWTEGKAALIKEGKRLKAAIEKRGGQV